MVTIDTIKKLRDKTNAGMMTCKAALIEAGGDLEKAETILRKQGIARAEGKFATRETSEGAIAARISKCGKTGVLLEVNCETDFVAKNENFRAFVDTILDHCITADPVADAEALAAQPFKGGADTVGDVLKAKVAEMGENMAIPRLTRYDVSGNGAVSSYIHMQGKVGVLIEMAYGKESTGGDAKFAELVKDLTLHIAALAPICLGSDEIPAARVETEREIYREQVKGKPENIIDKIVEGKVQKFYSEVCLLEQAFVKDGDTTVGKLIEAKAKELGDKISITRFTRYAVGDSAA